MKGLKQIYLGFKLVSDKTEKIVRFISAFLVFACFCSVFLQVFNRYVMVKQTLIPWKSISWTDELSRFLLVGIAYISLGLCYRHGQLSRADMIYSKLSDTPKRILYFVESAAILSFIGSCIIYGIRFSQANAIYRSDMLRIPGSILYLLPVVGMILIGFEVITEVLGVFSRQIEPFECLAPSENDFGNDI